VEIFRKIRDVKSLENICWWCFKFFCNSCRGT